MGEIGHNRDQFLHTLKWWEIRAIIDGYRKRERTYLLMTRWSTYMIMCTGMANLSKAGIHDIKDLLTFPWEQEERLRNMPTLEEFAEMDALLRQSQNEKDGQ